MCRGREERKEAGLESLGDSLPPTPNTAHKGKGVRPYPKQNTQREGCEALPPSEVLPLFMELHCKVSLRTKVSLTAACALRLGRCAQTGFPSCPGPWGSSCTQGIHAGHLLLACPPHITHLDSPHHVWGHLLLATLGQHPPQQAHVTSSPINISRWALFSSR